MDRIIGEKDPPGLRPVTNPVDSNGTIGLRGNHERHRTRRVGEGGEDWPQLFTGLRVT